MWVVYSAIAVLIAVTVNGKEQLKEQDGFLVCKSVTLPSIPPSKKRAPHSQLASVTMFLIFCMVFFFCIPRHMKALVLHTECVAMLCRYIYVVCCDYVPLPINFIQLINFPASCYLNASK